MKTPPAKPKAPARRPAPPPRRPSGAARGASNTGKVFVSLLSAVILLVTGIAWKNIKALQDGLTTQDVIGEEGGGERPADGAIDIMLVGMDSRTDAKGNPLPQEVLNELQAGDSESGGLNTDTLIMMHIPNDSSKAYAVSFPRDSYVQIAGGYGRHKINSAYGYGKAAAMERLQGERDAAKKEMESRKEGAKNLIKTVENLTGATIDHYAEVNLVGFYDITKAIGGVDVCLNAPVKDKFSGANFPAGQQTIQGRDALAFVRQRHGLVMGDLDRVVRQQVFMAGLAKKMLSAGVLTDSQKRGDLIKAVTKSIVLDPGWDITKFALQMKDMTGGNMSFQTIPTGTPELQTKEDGVAIEVDDGDVKKFVKELGKTPASTSPDAGDSKVDPKTVIVDVRNASGVAGLAGAVLQSLVAKGFAEGDAANADSNMATSVVKYGKGGEAAAAAVQKALGGMNVREDANVPAGRVRVFVGSDYSGPGAQGMAPKKLVQLDGTARQQPATPPPPITADGVRCVN
ncbi:LytTR family transcriptional regulator [Lentzea sp. NBRC 105346]|nr:LytTR family transcriptional regulator [Lentzea sp. NBRC 105346]